MEGLEDSNAQQSSSIDFKSSFARSLSVNDELLEHEVNDKFLSDCAEIDKLKDNCDETFYTLCDSVIDNGYNKSDEDKQLWIIKEKKKKSKKNQILNGVNIEDMNANEAEIEIIRLRKECQTLVELNRRLNIEQNNPFHDRKNSVQNAALQSKIETLEWQLKQVENSRDMYRAILEEVSRYLDTCHTTFESWLHGDHDTTNIERSKSILCVGTKTPHLDDDHPHHHHHATMSSMNLNCSTPYSIRQKSATLFSELSYNSFKDFSRRKCTAEESSNILSGHETDATTNHISIEKLSKQGFRLLRTVQNFLCTHEPILTSAEKCSDNKSSSLHDATIEASKSIAESLLKSKNASFGDNATLLSNSLEHHQKNNSSSSSEECPLYATSKGVTKSTKRFSTTEDESGFSSMSSFHEIGLPKIDAFAKSHAPPPSLPALSLASSDRKRSGGNDDEVASEKAAVARQEVIEGDESCYRVLWV